MKRVLLFTNMLLALILFSLSVSAQNISERSFETTCGSVFTQEHFVIESKSYPSNYPENFQCSYLLKGDACPTYFTLQLLDFNVEESLGCSKDRLEVADLDALCGTFSGARKYFSKSGSLVLRFVSDRERTGRGYRILVTRSSCTREEEVTTTQSSPRVPKWHTTSKDVESYATTPRTFNSSSNTKNCCKNIFQEKQFTLTSPNFPQSMSAELDCSYEIRKATESICRLRFHFHFFYLSAAAEKTRSCEDGYLEIDGKYFCGCQSELKLISAFNNQRKVIRFVSKSREKRSYTGFVVDVIQDECPKRLDNNASVNYAENYSAAIIGKLRLINEKTEILPGYDDRDKSTQVVQHIYYFAEVGDEEPRDGAAGGGTEREETDYLDTGASNNNFQVQDFNYCLNWNRQQFANIQSLTSSTQICKVKNEENTSSRRENNCVDLSYVRGYFKSPGYPLYYPGNVNVCYRFKMAPGYCAIRVHMKDFNVEESDSCRKDYFQLDQQKFCGSRLANSVLHLDMEGRRGGGSSKEMKFATDSFYCGRGFFGTYEQIACQDMTYPINPDFARPSTPTPPPPPPVPSEIIPCSRTFQQEVFTIQLMHNAIMKNSPTTCTFTINKYSPDVCRVRLYFEQFDLVCAHESIVIDGMMYCGHLSGKSVEVDVSSRGRPAAPVLVYRRRTSGEQVSGSRLVIRGVQTSECLERETPPPERLIDPRALQHNSSVSVSASASASSLESNSNSSLGYLLKIFKHKELCGMITNVTLSELPKTFCEFIIDNGLNNVTECLPLPQNALIVPVDSHLIELKIGDVKTIEEIEFSEIDCEDMPSSSSKSE